MLAGLGHFWTAALWELEWFRPGEILRGGLGKSWTFQPRPKMGSIRSGRKRPPNPAANGAIIRSGVSISTRPIVPLPVGFVQIVRRRDAPTQFIAFRPQPPSSDYTAPRYLTISCTQRVDPDGCSNELDASFRLENVTKGWQAPQIDTNTENLQLFVPLSQRLLSQ